MLKNLQIASNSIEKHYNINNFLLSNKMIVSDQ